MKRALTWMTMLLLASAGSASAFVGAEHEWFSRRAICVALDHLERMPADEASARRQRAIEVLTAVGKGNGQIPDYGQLVAYPDYVTLPNQMVDTSESGAERVSAVHVQGPTSAGAERPAARLLRTRR